MAGGTTVQLIPIFTPANATNRIVFWLSDNPSVATVNYDGLVTSLSKGQATITGTTQDGLFSASVHINVTSDPKTVYRIKSRWQNAYLYDAGDRVKYSLNASDKTYLWQIEELEGVKTIRNFSTGDYMHIENLTGYVQSTIPSPGTMSARWAVENTGDGFVRLKSESATTSYIHLENLQGQAQYGTILPEWWSAMWALEPVIIPTSAPSISIEKTAGIYPNPSRGDFNLALGNFTGHEKLLVTIFNQAGQVMFTHSCTVEANGSKNVKVSAGNILSSGNYLVVAKGNSSFARVKLLIAQ